MWGAVAGAVAAPIIGSLIGGKMAEGAQGDAARARQAALDALAGVQLPELEKQRLLLELPELQGKITPEEMQYVMAGPSAMEGISTDPRLREAQMQALTSLQTQGEAPLNATEMAELNKMRNQAAGMEQAKQAQIMQEMAARGAGGSGQELAARLMSQQASAQRGGEESDRLAAMAQQRALAAISSAGQLGGQIQEREFGQKARQAEAADVISKFNVQNQMSTQQANVQTRNQAQAANLAEKQRIAEQQTALRNKQQEFNKGLYQQQFENQYRKAGGMADQYRGAAQDAMQDAAGTRQMWGQIGSGVSSGLGAIAGGLLSKKDSSKTG